MTLAERATLHVLAGQADRRSVGEDGGQRQFLGRRPVDGPLLRIRQCRAPSRAPPFEFLVKGEAGRCGEQAVVDVPQSRQWNGRRGFLCDARRGRLRDRRDEILLGLQRLERLLEPREVLFEQRLNRFRRLLALPDQRVGEQLADRRVLRDGFVHQRLRERWLVAFVVPETTVSNEVNEKIPAEPGTVLPRETRGL